MFSYFFFFVQVLVVDVVLIQIHKGKRKERVIRTLFIFFYLFVSYLLLFIVLQHSTCRVVALCYSFLFLLLLLSLLLLIFFLVGFFFLLLLRAPSAPGLFFFLCVCAASVLFSTDGHVVVVVVLFIFFGSPQLLYLKRAVKLKIKKEERQKGRERKRSKINHSFFFLTCFFFCWFSVRPRCVFSRERKKGSCVHNCRFTSEQRPPHAELLKNSQRPRTEHRRPILAESSGKKAI